MHRGGPCKLIKDGGTEEKEKKELGAAQAGDCSLIKLNSAALFKQATLVEPK